MSHGIEQSTGRREGEILSRSYPTFGDFVLVDAPAHHCPSYRRSAHLTWLTARNHPQRIRSMLLGCGVNVVQAVSRIPRPSRAGNRMERAKAGELYGHRGDHSACG